MNAQTERNELKRQLECLSPGSLSYGKRPFPSGNYGVQEGSIDFRTDQVVWGGLYTFYTEESVAREIADLWRQEGIRISFQLLPEETTKRRQTMICNKFESVDRTASEIEIINELPTTPAPGRLAPFYKSVRLG